MAASPADVAQSRRRTLALPEIRAALEQQRALRAEQLAGPADGSPSHAVDASSEEVSRELQLTATRAVAEIDAALARIERGTYGACEKCGGDIAAERLEVLPTTNVCLRCARDRDRAAG